MGLKDMTGLRFGKLTVLERAENTESGKVVWKCRCDCGNIVFAQGDNLRNGGTKSCGCYKTSLINAVNTKHGESGTRLYKIWTNMRDRCKRENNRAYKNYGGRGINVCTEWDNSYEAFRDWSRANGYMDDLTLDRMDVSKGYNPDNCRWATYTEQANNTRKNVFLTWGGETHTLAEWARIRGLTGNALRFRLRRGWPLEQALSTPMKGEYSKNV